MEDVSERGAFWLPHAEDSQQIGELRYTAREGVRLELSGLLGSDFGGLADYPVVHGAIDRGKPVTVLNAHAIGQSIGKLPTERLVAETLIVGAHTKAVDVQRFREVFVHVELLPEWSRVIPLR